MANTAKEYLQRAYFLQLDIKSKQQQLEVLQSIAERATGTYEALRVSGTEDHSKMERAIIKMDSLRQRIAESTVELTKQYAEIAAVIETVDEPIYRTLLAYRYLGFKKWPEIVEFMHYDPDSISYVHKLHGRALCEVMKIIK